MRFAAASLLLALSPALAWAGSQPLRARRGMVVSESRRASEVGVKILGDGGSAVDAAVATAFALAVTFPAAGNIGGGGFLLFRPTQGDPTAYDFRETAPHGASAKMFLRNGAYDSDLHHKSRLSIGVPGTVSGLYLAWKENGRLPWRKLVEPAIALARDGFEVSDSLSRSFESVLPDMKRSLAALAQFSHEGKPYLQGEILKQPDLARTLERIAEKGDQGFYSGETAALIEKEMEGVISRADLEAYHARKRVPLRGSYRGYEVLGIPPPSSGGTVVLEVLNILEGCDLKTPGYSSAAEVHLVAEAMRRAYADRAQFLGDPDQNKAMPIARLISKPYADELRRTIDPAKASSSSPSSITLMGESPETTHLSVVDEERNAVALTFTLEDYYGSKIVVSGGGFLLNNEMGDFNAGPGLTTAEGLIGTAPNLAAPGKRMLSGMAPTILTKDGNLFLVLGSPGGRSIPSSVVLTILNVLEFGMNVQEAIDVPRYDHEWLPDRIRYEERAFSPDTLRLLEGMGHRVATREGQGRVQAILVDPREGVLVGGSDRRAVDGGIGAR